MKIELQEITNRETNQYCFRCYGLTLAEKKQKIKKYMKKYCDENKKISNFDFIFGNKSKGSLK